MPSARQFAGSRFIALADVIDKEPLRELIEYAKAEEGRFGKKLVLYSRSGLKLSLNKSSAGVLCRDIDEDYDAWFRIHRRGLRRPSPVPARSNGRGPGAGDRGRKRAAGAEVEESQSL